MTVIFAIAIYFIVWWVVLFAVLPFGVRTQGEAGNTVPGTSPSAPAGFRFGRVIVINTIVSFGVFCVIWLLIDYDAFGIGELADKALR